MQEARNSIYRKLAGLSLIAFIAMLVLALFYSYQIHRISDTASYAGKNMGPAFAGLARLHDNFITIRMTLYKQFQYRPEAFKFGVLEDQLRPHRKAVFQAIEAYKQDLAEGDAKKNNLKETNINRIETNWIAYNKAIDPIIIALRENTEHASDLIQQNEHFATEIDRLAMQLAEYEMKVGQQGIVDAEEITQRTINYSIILTLAMALAIAASVYFVTRKITKEFSQSLENHGWVKSNVTALSLKLQQAETVDDFAQLVIAELSPLLEGGAAAFYNLQGEHYVLLATWGVSNRQALTTKYAVGEGLVGQCAQNAVPIRLNNIPPDYMQISSGIGGATPRVITLMPIKVKDKVIGVIELASFSPMTDLQQSLLDEVEPVIALNLEVIKRNRLTLTLLEETQMQANKLQASEEELRMQSEELQASEEELRAKNDALNETNEELKRQGEALHEAREEAHQRADELEKISHYKSDFLSNMSHELRTPLNSLLILAKDLAENEEENLSAEQVESAQIIFEGGENLLRLINDILDLSKVEAGKMVLCVDDVNLEAFASGVQRNLSALAKSKSLTLDVTIAPDVPTLIKSDVGKMDQIMMNLIGNAFKFTTQGGVMVRISLLKDQVSNKDRLSIAVEDTGIGIPADKLETVFNAFEQVDGSSSREHGGTGLGLSISRRLATLLGGDITVTSVEGKGCTFALILPLQLEVELAEANAELDNDARVEDNDGLTMDVGEDVKATPNKQADGLSQVLVVDPENVTQKMLEAMGFHQAVLSAAPDGEAALTFLKANHVDCMVLELNLPDMDGFELLNRVKAAGVDMPSIVVYTNRDLSYEDNHQLHGYTDSIVVKSSRSSERLSDELKRALQGAPQRGLDAPIEVPEVGGKFLEGKTVLIVEDDMRNAFALSKVLRHKGLTVLLAQDGFKALSQLEDQPQIDIVLMDMMMPGKDGYETMQEIRQQSRFDQMPIIALTAKALKSDRKKCLQAGANDYLSKPIDISLLLTTMTTLLQSE